MPVRALVHRFAFLFLIVAAFGIMLLGKAETLVVERLRATVVDVVAPIMDGLSQPIATVSSGVDRVAAFFDVYEENALLREQNARLLKWQAAARVLAAENERFRALLGHVPEPGTSYAAARVIGDTGGVFVRSVLINAGRVNGIGNGDAVIDERGLVGRVADTGRQSARVLLISDLNSRIPVVTEGSRTRAILAGDNSPTPKLAFLPPNARVSPGDTVVTSGHGGVFPAGLPIGRVVGTGEGTLRVRPNVDFDRLEFVRIVTEFPGRDVDELTPSKVRATTRR